jgi:hypothetical protein
MQKLFFTAKEWNRFAWNMQEVLCKKYEVILTDYQTRKEKTISLLNKINMKNFNKGMDAFNKLLNKFSKTVDSLTSNKSGFNQGKNMDDALGKVNFSKDAIWGKYKEDTHSFSIWGKPIKLSDSPVSIWPEKTKSDKPKDNLKSIWGKRDDE